MRAQRIDQLPMRTGHILRLECLEPLHADPFDRMLIAQALAEELPIITSDTIFKRYGVDVLW
jgi:PIN domain nuclease of toxin-antitoxin system